MFDRNKYNLEYYHKNKIKINEQRNEKRRSLRKVDNIDWVNSIEYKSMKDYYNKNVFRYFISQKIRKDFNLRKKENEAAYNTAFNFLNNMINIKNKISSKDSYNKLLNKCNHIGCSVKPYNLKIFCRLHDPKTIEIYKNKKKEYLQINKEKIKEYKKQWNIKKKQQKETANERQ